MLMSFITHRWNRVLRGWTLGGLHGCFTEEVENMPFSVICAFSEIQFSGLIINQHTKTTAYISSFSKQVGGFSLIKRREIVKTNFALFTITIVFIKLRQLGSLYKKDSYFNYSSLLTCFKCSWKTYFRN